MLESLGLFGLFIGVMLSATLVPFSSDALYVGALLIGKTPVVLTLLVATAGSWAGAMITYYLGRKMGMACQALRCQGRNP